LLLFNYFQLAEVDFCAKLVKGESKTKQNTKFLFRWVVLAVGCWLLAVGYWLLAVGRWLLAVGVGCWLLAVGCWLLVVGRWLLAVGGWPLAVGQFWRICIPPALIIGICNADNYRVLYSLSESYRIKNPNIKRGRISNPPERAPERAKPSDKSARTCDKKTS
jgi:hypothetical protein